MEKSKTRKDWWNMMRQEHKNYLQDCTHPEDEISFDEYLSEYLNMGPIAGFIVYLNEWGDIEIKESNYTKN